MSISKFILENMNQPIPRSGLGVCFNIECELFHFCFQNPALRICAKTNLQACNIRGLFVDDAMNNGWTSIVNECLACWFGSTIEESTKLSKDIVANILSMDTNIIFKDSEDDDTKSTFVIKTIIRRFWSITEVSVGARGLEGFQF